MISAVESKKPEKWRWLFVFALFGLFLPVFGLIIALLLYLTHRERPTTALFAEDEEFLTLPEKETAHPAVAPVQGRETALAESFDIVPLRDILLGSDTDLKRWAVEKLAQLGTPAAVQILLEFRGDPSPEMRFYVTSALGRIKNAYDEELGAAQEEMKKNVYKISARLFLAKTYLRYAESRLLDPATSRVYEDEAVSHLEFCTRSEYASAEAFEILLTLREARGEWDPALKLAQTMADKGILGPERVVETGLKRDFHQRDFARLVRGLNRLAKLDKAGSQWLAMANWWGG